MTRFLPRVATRSVSKPRPSGAHSRRMVAAVAVATALFALAALPVAPAQEASGTVTNATPSVGSLTLYSSAPTAGASCSGGTSSASFNPTQGSTTTVHICAVITDANGWNDACGTGSARTYTVKSTDNSTTLGSKTGTLSCATGSGESVALYGSFTMEYWRLPATGANYYHVTVNVTDVASATASRTNTLQYAQLKAISVGDASFGFGSLAPGNSGTDSASVYNQGNVAFTIYVAGTAFTGSSKAQTIAVGSLTHGASSGTESTALTSSAATASVSAPVETSDSATARSVYMKLTVPTATSGWVPSDTYSGTLTFTAV